MSELKVDGLKEVISDLGKLSENVDKGTKSFLEMAIAAEKAVKATNGSNLKDYIQLTKQESEEVAKLQKQKDNLRQAENALNKEVEKQASILKEQIALENNLISTKKKNELATESTSRALAAERIQLAEKNKQIKQEALEQLGLVSAYTKLNNERNEAKKVLRDLIITEGESSKSTKQALKDFEALDAKVRSADRAVGDFTKNVGNYPLQNLGSGLKNLIGAFGLVGGVSLFADALKGAYDTFKKFEQGLADLSAITGATGKDLAFLKDSAIELGKTTQGGAIAVVEAYKLIASAKPELLEDVQALNQVTEATITLSKAAGMELPAAASALTDAMNQFGADAKQANTFIDALANGAKYGAAEIPQVTEALLKFGAVARSSNVNIKESTALVELLAENGLKGADAGTALRNVMLKISAPDALPRKAQEALHSLGIDFATLKDKSVSFQEKIELLKPLLNDNAKLVKVFGLENIVAAQNVIEHTDRLKELTSKMGEVGTAEEQAAIRMNTLKGDTEQLSNRYDSLVLSVSNGSGIISKTLGFIVEGTKGWLIILQRFNDSWDELQKKAKAEGNKEGDSTFRRLMGDKKGEEAIKAAESNIRTTRNNLKTISNQIKETEDELKKAEGKFLNFGPSPKTLNLKLEELKKSQGEFERVMKLSKEFIIDEKNKSKANETEKSPVSSSASTDKILLKEIKDRENAERKKLELTINAMKIALDNQITFYDQSKNTEDENLAHVEVISQMKIKIAQLELQKNLIGIKSGSAEEKAIREESKQDYIKIENEKSKAINQIRYEGVKFELEVYNYRNKTLLQEGATINDLLIEQEKKRINDEYDVNKKGLEKLNELDAEKVKLKYKNNEKLTEQEFKFLKEIEALEKKKDDETKKADKLNLDTKLKINSEEEKDADRKFKLLQKGTLATSIFELKEEEKRLKKDLSLQAGNAKEEEKINMSLAENKQKQNDLVVKSKMAGLEASLSGLIEFAGKESAVGKTAAIAQATINTYEGATKALSEYPAPYSYVVAGLTIANGLATVAKIEGVQMFAEGTLNAPYTGKAIVDELGAEIHLSSSGQVKSMGSNKGARFTDIAKGDVIIPADVSAIIKQMTFSSYGIKDNSPSIDYNEIGAQFGKHASKIVGAIQNKKESRMIVNVQRNIDNRVTFKGIRV